ncbi:sulfotransferase family 2 domain-containing protein [Flavobacteriaceae bacterium GSB9]|nr:sulfotransferase family 2 domain-containing protein [Flavobacteriaceae bacterium GSB9]
MIVFIHIPKTAGTTFYSVVKNNYNSFLRPKIDREPVNYLVQNLKGNNISLRLPGGYTSAPQMIKVLEEHFADKLNEVSFIGGHIGYGLHKLTSKDIKYITFIRDPKSRLISDFKEHHKPGRFFYEDLKKNGFRLNDYLKLLKEMRLDNIMTRQLAGPYDYFLLNRSTVSESMLNMAIGNSMKVDVYKMENFDEALYLMKKNMGWKSLKYTEHNISKQTMIDLEFDSDLLNDVIKFDLILYKELNKNVLNNFKLNWSQRLEMKLNNIIY